MGKLNASFVIVLVSIIIPITNRNSQLSPCETIQNELELSVLSCCLNFFSDQVTSRMRTVFHHSVYIAAPDVFCHLSALQREHIQDQAKGLHTDMVLVAEVSLTFTLHSTHRTATRCTLTRASSCHCAPSWPPWCVKLPAALIPRWGPPDQCSISCR